jgi:hypothetical protein
MMIVDLIFGFLLVLAGRNLFWLCVGIVGFLMGVQFSQSLGLPQGWTALLAAIGLGCLGVILAISFEWFTVVFGVGFLGGGYLLMSILPSITGQDAWPIFVIGGILGTCMMVIVFDWALIVISSLLGATLIVNAFAGRQVPHELLFLVSFVTGILAQYLTLRYTSDPEHAPRSA